MVTSPPQTNQEPAVGKTITDHGKGNALFRSPVLYLCRVLLQTTRIWRIGNVLQSHLYYKTAWSIQSYWIEWKRKTEQYPKGRYKFIKTVRFWLSTGPLIRWKAGTQACVQTWLYNWAEMYEFKNVEKTSSWISDIWGLYESLLAKCGRRE